MIRRACLVALLLNPFAWTAPRPPVQWRVQSAPTKPVKAGAPFTVAVVGTIDPGWHLYALQEPENGPVATEISITEGDPADLLHVDQERPRTLNDPLFSQPTAFFEGHAQFTLHLRATREAAAGTHALQVLIRYQSCNDHVCLPPHTDTVEIPLTITR